MFHDFLASDHLRFKISFSNYSYRNTKEQFATVISRRQKSPPARSVHATLTSFILGVDDFRTV